MGGTGPTPTAGGVPPGAEQLETGQGSGTVGGRRPRVAPSPDPGPGSEPDISPPESPLSMRDSIEREMNRRLEARLAILTAEFDSRMRIERASREAQTPPPGHNDLVSALKEAFVPRATAGAEGSAASYSGGKNFVPPDYTPRDQVGPTQFLYHMDRFFEYAKVPESERVIAGVMRLRDAASSWWKTHLLVTTDENGNPTGERIVAWADFARGLKQQFTPVSEKRIMRDKLYDLRQAGTVQSYTALFREYQFELGDVLEMEAYTLYRRGLKTQVQDGIATQDPKTLAQTIEFAEQWDARNRGKNHGTSGASPSKSSASGSGKSRFFAKKSAAKLNAAQIEGAGDNAEAAVAAVGSQKKKQGGGGKKSQANGPPNPERQRLQKEGRCFNCKETGHMARDCPQENASRQ